MGQYLKKVWLFLKYTNNEYFAKEAGKTGKKKTNKYMPIILVLLFIVYLAVILGYLILQNVDAVSTNLKTMLIPSIFISSCLFLFIYKFKLNATNTGGTYANTFPLTNFQKFLTHSIESYVITMFVFVIALITGFVVSYHTKDYWLVPKIVAIILVANYIAFVLMSILADAVFYLVSKIANKKTIEYITMGLQILLFIAIFALFTSMNDTRLFAKIFESTIFQNIQTAFVEFNNLFFGTITSTTIWNVVIVLLGTVVLTYIAYNFDNYIATKVVLQAPVKKVTQKSESKEFANLKNKKSKESAFFSYEKDYYKKSFTLVFYAFAPTLVMPIIFGIVFFISGISTINKEVNTAKDYTIAIMQEQKEEKVKLDVYDNAMQTVQTVQNEYKMGPLPNEAVKEIVTPIVTAKMEQYKNVLSQEQYEKDLTKGIDVTQEAIADTLKKDFVIETIQHGLPQEIQDHLKKNEDFGKIIFLVTLGFAVFAVVFNTLGFFTISKDKENINMLKTLPMRKGKQLILKRIIPLSGSLLTLYLYAFVVFLLVREFSVTGLILGTLLIVSVVRFQQMIDILMPNFNWTKPTDLVKRSKLSFISSLFAMALIFLMILAGFAASKIGLEKVYYIVLIAVSALFILSQILLKPAKARFEKLEATD